MPCVVVDSSLCDSDAFDLDLLFQVARPGKVECQLHAEPRFRGRTECLGQPVSYFDRDRRLFIDQIRKRLTPATKPPCRPRIPTSPMVSGSLLARWRQDAPGFSLPCQDLLMVIDIHGMSVLEPNGVYRQWSIIVASRTPSSQTTACPTARGGATQPMATKPADS